ncbi:helix-turn-helix domain-containing protein [Syntrophomonas palmitatica]|uniref:helix-turn-helix domain-containing protein n=1 Tax=Syntrophomonas palmitatica TaxID=402877 RepID=UPI00155DB583|nr:helix-turn-helix transcriptional regulator [Syntrophomonas palmitatica]
MPGRRAIKDVGKVEYPQRLSALRKAKGLTQAQLCEELGIKVNAYREWEMGRRRPELESLIMLAEYYGVSMDYLLGLEHVTLAASQAGDPLADLSDEARQSVYEFIEFVRQRDKKK